MASRASLSQNAASGFTLLETLVALGIASLLIATLIPISRNTMFRIATLSEQAQALAVLERATSGTPSTGEDPNADTGIALRTTKKPLPPFAYPRDQRDQWQPVLVTIEARGPRGSVTRTELITLERVRP